MQVGATGALRWCRNRSREVPMRAMDVMTSEVITVDQNATVPEAAKLLTEHGISAVPVVDKGDRVIGIVSRANLVRALTMTINEAADGAEADDRAIRDKLLAELKVQKWAEVSPANVTVKDGVVHLWSSYLSEQEKRALVVAAENVPGVRRVEDHMRPVPAYLLG